MSFVIAEFAEWITECDQLWKKNIKYGILLVYGGKFGFKTMVVGAFKEINIYHKTSTKVSLDFIGRLNMILLVNLYKVVRGRVIKQVLNYGII